MLLQSLQKINRTVTINASRAFSQNSLLNTLNADQNHNLRVMSTPEWPVPYYTRAFRHPPSFEKTDMDLTHFLVPISDVHVMLAKEQLKSIGEGHIVEAIENHFDISSKICQLDYRTSFQDSAKFSEAYVDDMLDCLDVAYKQNTKLLNEFDLADVLKA